RRRLGASRHCRHGHGLAADRSEPLLGLGLGRAHSRSPRRRQLRRLICYKALDFDRPEFLGTVEVGRARIRAKWIPVRVQKTRSNKRTALEGAMTEVLFYHLQNQPLEAVLPALLEKCLERDWRVVVEAGSVERCEALDALLWTYGEESFLPHGLWRDADAAQHPILLTAEPDNPNSANVRFLVAGAAAGELGGYLRAVL